MVKKGPPMDNMVERRLIKHEGDHHYYYLRVKIGGPINDREVVVKKTDNFQPDGSLLYTI
jgi:hypothetical protein